MKTYEIKYHTVARHCCRRTKAGSKIIQIQARDPEDAKLKLRRKVPGARFERVTEIVRNP